MPDQVTVLLLEGHKGCRDATNSLLSTYGYNCLAFESVDDAAQTLEQLEQCIVLADFEFAREILANSAFKANARVIGMSSDASPDLRSACLVAGAEKFLSKPYDPMQLIGLLEEMIRDL